MSNLKRLHIVGCPRSGTTLLMELVATCFDHDARCDHEISLFQPGPIDEGLYLTKQPNDIKQLGHVFEADPNLFVIYMGRDPRAVITSKHRENPGQYFCNYRVWKECDVDAQRYENHPRFLRLRYEDLVARPDDCQQLIAERFGFLVQRYTFSNYHEHAESSAAASTAMNGLREVNLDSLKKWQQHLPRIAEQLARHPGIAEDLLRLGYEQDNAWMELLENVEAQVFPCRYPERREFFKELEKSLRVYLKSRRYLKRRIG